MKKRSCRDNADNNCLEQRFFPYFVASRSEGKADGTAVNWQEKLIAMTWLWP
jgi:hypothetical protein